MNSSLIVTCEHGGNEVPATLRPLFAGRDDLLTSHRGWDPGALDLARKIALTFDAPLFESTISRLVVDLNRSPHHRAVFSELTRQLPVETRRQLLDRYYHPWRRRVREAIIDALSRAPYVVHLSVHTFTPVLRGEVRTADIGILYDPRRPTEMTFSRRWSAELRGTRRWRVRRNYPYLGRADGHTTAQRREFPATQYVGIELEVNQALNGTTQWASIGDDVCQTLHTVLNAFPVKPPHEHSQVSHEVH